VSEQSPTNEKSARFVLAIQALGSNATSPRDAAHEACHAMQWGVKKKWTRDNIHAKKPRERARGVRCEILARAVEQLVCADLGIDCGTVERWALVCWMEMIKNEGISLPTGDWLANNIRAAMETPEARDLAYRVLALTLG
jgi:hypothetical protein